MARNEPSGDNRRVGPVRKRTQLKTKVMGKAATANSWPEERERRSSRVFGGRRRLRNDIGARSRSSRSKYEDRQNRPDGADDGVGRRSRARAWYLRACPGGPRATYGVRGWRALSR